MKLLHFGEDPTIEVFHPRPVLVPSERRPGQEWLNGPLVWAIDERHQFLYLFPRECPRILAWATGDTTDADRDQWLKGSRAVAFIEAGWMARLQEGVLYRYELPAAPFRDLGDAGMWVSEQSVTPLSRIAISDAPARLAKEDVKLIVVDRLTPLRRLWSTSLHVSGIRLRNAEGWTGADDG